jgi:hypothetical protein
MMRLDLKANFAIDAADQRVQDIHGDIDHGLAVGALQVRVRSRGLADRFRDSEMVNRGGAADVRVGDQPELTECRQGTIDRRPVNSRCRCLGASDDLLSSEVLLGAVQDLDDGLAGSGHALVLVAEQVQRGLDAGR